MVATHVTPLNSPMTVISLINELLAMLNMPVCIKDLAYLHVATAYPMQVLCSSLP